MFRLVTSTRAKDGKVGEAIAALKELTAFVATKYNFKAEIYVQQFGPAHVIYSITDVNDLLTVQVLHEKWMLDEGLRTLVRKADVFIEPPTTVLLRAV
jgi:polysaccharide pyruvyl transferase WcaK-like protein